MKIAILGFGNIANTFAQSFINSGAVYPQEIFVLFKEKPLVPHSFIPCENFSDNADFIIHEADVVILSVKPQDFANLADQIKGCFTKKQLVVSVMAGVKMETIVALTGASKIIRSMPNVAIQIGMGMTVFTASDNIGRVELMLVQNLLNTSGKSIYVEDESLIDVATAISGSGPAYVFYLMEAMSEAAQKLGFNTAQAETLVHQTFMGAINLQNSSSLNASQLIAKVASKGGTTEKALEVFDSAQLKETVVLAINKANLRAQELGS